jgi:uncharacterized protein YbaP (TraB family)
MMPSMSRDYIERAERLARRMEERAKVVEAVKESKAWKRPRSLRGKPVKRTRVRNYEFTDKQLEIALRSLDAEGSV